MEKVKLKIEISSDTYIKLQKICAYLEYTNLERYYFDDGISELINDFYSRVLSKKIV